MSLPWPHHILCDAPLSKEYAFKIVKSKGRLHVIAKHHKIDCYFYPKDRTSHIECDTIIEELKRDIEAL